MNICRECADERHDKHNSCCAVHCAACRVECDPPTEGLPPSGFCVVLARSVSRPLAQKGSVEPKP